MVCVPKIFANTYNGSPLSWAGDFLRNSDDFPDNVDSKYLTNQRSAAQFFLRWFTHDNSMSYESMLRSAHRIAACGVQGGNYYTIPTPCGERLVPSPQSTDEHIIYESPILGWVRETYPGVMRSDLEANGVEHPTEDVVILTHNELCALADARAHGIAVLPIDNCHVSDDAKASINGLFYIKPMDCDVRLPVVRHSQYRFSRQAPEGVCQARLLEICSQRIKECRSMFLSNKTRDLIRHLLAYYHTALNLMPFANINNSLFMGHVNAIMRVVALPCLPHASLDSFALVCSYDSFATVVRTTNPALDIIDKTAANAKSKR